VIRENLFAVHLDGRSHLSAVDSLIQQSLYAPIQGEALAVADSLDKTRYFVLGCKDLTIAVDHEPLLKIFSDRSLEEISNNRLRNLKKKTLRYRFRMVHVPGVKHRTTDCLSRHPASDAEKLILLDDVALVTNHRPLGSLHLENSNIQCIREVAETKT
jgi:hypothetical protein